MSKSPALDWIQKWLPIIDSVLIVLVIIVLILVITIKSDKGTPGKDGTDGSPGKDGGTMQDGTSIIFPSNLSAKLIPLSSSAMVSVRYSSEMCYLDFHASILAATQPNYILALIPAKEGGNPGRLNVTAWCQSTTGAAQRLRKKSLCW